MTRRGRQPALLMLARAPATMPRLSRGRCTRRSVSGCFLTGTPAIGRYIARRLGPDAADDLVAEAFLVAFRRRGRYDLARGDARPWLYGIATRLIGRHRREEVRFFRAIARTGVDPAAEPLDDQVTDRIAARRSPTRSPGCASTPPPTTWPTACSTRPPRPRPAKPPASPGGWAASRCWTARKPSGRPGRAPRSRDHGAGQSTAPASPGRLPAAPTCTSRRHGRAARDTASPSATCDRHAGACGRADHPGLERYRGTSTRLLNHALGGSERVFPCFSIIPRGAIEQHGRCGPSARCGTTGSVMQAGR